MKDDNKDFLPVLIFALGIPWSFILFKLLSKSKTSLVLFEFMLYSALGLVLNFLTFVILWRIYQ